MNVREETCEKRTCEKATCGTRPPATATATAVKSCSEYLDRASLTIMIAGTHGVEHSQTTPPLPECTRGPCKCKVSRRRLCTHPKDDSEHLASEGQLVPLPSRAWGSEPEPRAVLMHHRHHLEICVLRDPYLSRSSHLSLGYKLARVQGDGAACVPIPSESISLNHEYAADSSYVRQLAQPAASALNVSLSAHMRAMGGQDKATGSCRRPLLLTLERAGFAVLARLRAYSPALRVALRSA